MKTKKFALLIILSMLVTGFAGAGSYIVEDDIYYNPNDKNPVVEKKEKEAQKELQEKAAVKKTLMATSDNHFRDVDEYNRRGESSDMTLEDIAANQKEDYVEYNLRKRSHLFLRELDTVFIVTAPARIVLPELRRFGL